MEMNSVEARRLAMQMDEIKDQKYTGSHEISDAYMQGVHDILMREAGHIDIHVVIGVEAASREPYFRSAHFDRNEAARRASEYRPRGDLDQEPEIRTLRLADLEADVDIRRSKREILIELQSEIYQLSHAGAPA